MKTTLKAILIAATLTLGSCSLFQSTQKRAQTHLAKAVSLDPTILKTSEKDSIRLKDSVVYHDSTRVKDSINIITHDSTIITPKSDLNGNIQNPCDSIKGLKPFDYNLGSGVHKLHIWSDGKTIRYSSTVDELVSTIRSKDTYISHLEDSLHSQEINHQKEVSQLKNTIVTIVKFQPTLWQTIKRLFIGLIGGLALGFVLFKVLGIKLFGL